MLIGLVALALTAPATAAAAWEPVGGVVNADDSGGGDEPRLANVGGTLHVGYTNFDVGATAVGARFQGGDWQDLPEPSTVSFSQQHDVAAVAGQLHATWTERQTTEDDFELVVGRLVNGAWQKLGGALAADVVDARLAAFGSTPCVASIQVASDGDLFVRCFEGGSWVTKGGGRLDPAGVDAVDPELAVIAGQLHVAWGAVGNGGKRPRVARLDGSSWTPLGTGDDPITGSASTLADDVSLADIGGVPHVAFSTSPDREEENVTVRVSRFVSGEWTPLGDQSDISDPNLDASDVSLAAVAGVPHVAFTELSGGNSLVRAKRLLGPSNWETFGGDAPLNRGAGSDAADPHIIDVNGMLHLAWSETPFDSGRGDINVNRYVGGIGNLTPPRLTGGTTAGGRLTCDSGTWSGDPVAYTFAWERAPAGTEAWAPVAGVTSNQYVVQTIDGGKRLRCRVTASDGIDSAEAVSNAVDVTVPFVPPAPPPPPPPPPPSGRPSFFRPPIASGLSATSTKLPSGVWLSAAGSQAQDGAKIKVVEWDINNDLKPDITCGSDTTAASAPFRKPGIQPVGLTVTDDRGMKATSVLSVNVGVNQISRRPTLVSTCERPDNPFTPTPADCVKNFAWGIVDVRANGVKSQCFRVDGDPAKATIKGAVKLNGLPLPIPSDFRSNYDSGTNEISLGEQAIKLELPFTTVNLTKLALTKVVKAGKDGRFQLGAAKAATPGIKALGGLKMGAGAELYLLEGRRSEVKMSLQLPNIFSFGYGRALEGTVTVRGDNARGFEFEGARLLVPFASFGPLGLEEVFFEYTKQNDQLTVGANIRLLPYYGPVIEASPVKGYGFVMRKGKFFQGGLGVTFEPSQPVFPGIGLSHVGAVFGVDPLRFSGRLGITGGEIVDIQGTAFVALATHDNAFDFPDEFIQPGLEFLSGRRLDSFSAAIGGEVGLKVPVIGKLKLSDGHVFYAHPGLIEAGGKIEFKKDLKVGKFSIKGKVGGFADFDAGKFSFSGGVEGCMTIDLPGILPEVSPCLPAGGTVSSKGAGFCSIFVPPFPFPSVPIPYGAGMKWTDSLPTPMVFSCDYKDYEEKNARAGRAAQATRSVSLPAGLPAAQIRVTGQGGVPAVTVTRPNGQKVAMPASDFAVFDGPDGSSAIVALNKPAAGSWTIGTEPGSPPITKVEVAEALEKPRVRAAVSGTGATRTLTWSLTSAAGQTVTFYEKGRRTWRELGVAKGDQGRLTFTPADGAAETRRIVAIVERGVIARELTVARYRAAGTARPARPSKLRVRRRGARVTTTWKKVPGAERYVVTLRPRVGIPVLRMVRATRTSLPIARGMRGTVTVIAQKLDARPSPAARASVPAR